VPVLHDLHLWWVVVGFGVLAMALLLGGLAVGWAPLVGWGLGALGGEYTVFFTANGRSLDELTPVYAAWFMLVAELAYWSLEPRVPAWTEPRLLARRLSQIGISCVGASVLAAVVLVIAGASGGGGLALELLGALAAVGALGVVAALARSKSLG
jgi:hypothetical protein